MQLNPINLEGTEFQKKVWREISKIPKGKTKTYKEIAILVGSPKSYRAVANACGKNPFPVAIPCHRVIKSDGSIGGYSAKGGVRKKKALLLKECNE
jgi:methylated-DNA-[protein]-cysteine S-methyltransferase